MPGTLQNQLENLLPVVKLPWSGQTLGEAGAVIAEAESGALQVQLDAGYPAAASAGRLDALLREALDTTEGLADSAVMFTGEVRRHAVQGTLTPVENISNIVAVSSAKGGVGKSTVAVNTALALAREGAAVGILDADIYGPSQPIMLGVSGTQPVSQDGKSFEPIEAHGLQMISIGNIVDATQPMVWRGPMVTSALNQLLFQTNWRDLDYLIIDMPPGTGDIQLTLAQKVPVSGAVIVTTPQDIALADAVRGLRMFEKVDIPVLGLVENMASFVCPSCGEITPLFGHGGGVNAAAEHGMTLLGQLPLELAIREATDSGAPTVVSDPDGPMGIAFRDVALATAAQLAARPRDFKGAFGQIKVE